MFCDTETATGTTNPNLTCPELTRFSDCHPEITDCPIDCNITHWTDWSECSTSCDEGQQTRSRQINVFANPQGTPCPTELDQIQECLDPVPCVRPCAVSDWSGYTSCSATCGNGTHTRTRTIITAATPGGECYPLVEVDVCQDAACPLGCETSEWSAWSSCSLTCGGGVRTANKTITVEPQPGGAACPPLGLEESCNIQQCPVDCQLSDWTQWSDCSLSCGGGLSTRDRFITVNPAHGGQACNSTQNEALTCNTQLCPIDCQVNQWSEWSGCSVSCGNGLQSRTRDKNITEANGGTCPFALRDTHECQQPSCTRPCDVGEWTPWTPCDIPCETPTMPGIRYSHLPIFIQPIPANTTDPDLKCPDVISRTTDCHDITPQCPIPCEQTPWTEWSACSTVCGSGNRERSRSILVYPNYIPCGPQIQLAPCEPQPPCPQPCILNEWSDWSACSVTCGAGLHTRNRTVNETGIPESNCYPLDDVDSCTDGPCSVGCVVSDWGSWSPCTATCGGGMYSKNRTVLQQPMNGGHECPGLTFESDCGLDPCPVDCVIGPWSDYLDCSESCGGGTQTRNRVITVDPQNNGTPCGDLNETITCNTDNCPVDCVMNEWSEWDACTVTCGNGFHTRVRTKNVTEAFNGTCVFNTTDTQPCSGPACESPCFVSDWPEWSPCSATCGNDTTATRTATRNITRRSIPDPPVLNPSYACPPEEDLISVTPCVNVSCCPVPCVQGEWGEWGACTLYCGQTGGQIRTRDTIVQPLCNGTPCLPGVEQRNCSHCECQVGEWGEWSECTRTCGTGERCASRPVTIPAAPGQTCDNDQVRHQPCNTQECPEFGSAGIWSEWSPCTEACGNGIHTRNRTILQPPMFGAPDIETGQTEPCTGTDCPRQCTVSEWSDFGPCDITCQIDSYPGTRGATRQVTQGPNPANTTDPALACPDLVKTTSCNVTDCPQPCVLTDWSEWSACSATCGDGLSVRTRVITKYGTSTCDTILETRTCSAPACPTPCEYDQWSAWSDCSLTCGEGVHDRTRSITVPATNGGFCANLTAESDHCFVVACPQECDVSEWTQWTACSASCDGGTATRDRSINSTSTVDCPPLNDTEGCNETPCSVDCVAEWSQWTQCSVSCAIGTRSRHLKISVHESNGGTPCGPDTQTDVCVGLPCPIDCVVTQWSEWGDCSVTCGNDGISLRNRSIELPAINGGNCLDSLGESRPCHGPICETPCVVSEWSDFSPCPVTCGSANETIEVSTRTILSEPSGNITDPAYLCPPPEDLIRYTPCVGVELCPIDCRYGEWGEWGACSQFSGEGGVRARVRQIVQSPVNGGLSCQGEIVDELPCNQFQTQVANYTCVDFLNTQNCTGGLVPMPNPGRIQCNGPCEANVCCQAFPSVPANCQLGTNHPETACAQKLVNVSPQPPVDFYNIPIVDPFGNTTDPNLLLGCQPQTSYCLGLDGCVTVEMPHWFSAHVVLYFYEPTAADTSIDISANSKSFDLFIGSEVDKLYYVNNYLISSSFLYNTGLPEILYQNIIIPENGCFKYIKVCDTSPLELQQVNDFTDDLISLDNTTVEDSDDIIGLDEDIDEEDLAEDSIAYSVDNWIALAMIQSTDSCACVVNQTVTEWTGWSDCTVSCGDGMQGRFREPLTQAAYGGTVFRGDLNQTRVCMRDACGVDCVVGEWSNFTECSTTCDPGVQTRNRSVIVQPSEGGRQCPFSDETLECNTDPQESCGFNEATGCTASEWTEWGFCSNLCGAGLRSQVRTILSPGQDPSTCPPLLKVEFCVEPCEPFCILETWSEWSVCPAFCSDEPGFRSRVRDVILYSNEADLGCEGTQETQECESISCPIYGPQEREVRPEVPIIPIPLSNGFEQFVCPGPIGCVDELIIEFFGTVNQYVNEVVSAPEGIEPFQDPANVLGDTGLYYDMKLNQVATFRFPDGFHSELGLNFIFTVDPPTGMVEISRDGICWVDLGGLTLRERNFDGQTVVFPVPNGCYNHVRVTSFNDETLGEPLQLANIYSGVTCIVCNDLRSPTPTPTVVPSASLSPSESALPNNSPSPITTPSPSVTPTSGSIPTSTPTHTPTSTQSQTTTTVEPSETWDASWWNDYDKYDKSTQEKEKPKKKVKSKAKMYQHDSTDDDLDDDYEDWYNNNQETEEHAQFDEIDDPIRQIPDPRVEFNVDRETDKNLSGDKDFELLYLESLNGVAYGATKGQGYNAEGFDIGGETKTRLQRQLL